MYFQNDDSEYEAGGIGGWQHRAQAVLEDNLAADQPMDTRPGVDREWTAADIRAAWARVNADNAALLDQIRQRVVAAPRVRTIGQMYQPTLVEGGDRGDQQG